jgi:hypothetical protein
MEREGDIIIRVTIARGAIIKVFIFEAIRHTQGLNKTEGKSCPKDFKI